jgi:hypothetical protein
MVPAISRATPSLNVLKTALLRLFSSLPSVAAEFPILILIYHQPFSKRRNNQYDARGPRIADQHMHRSPLLRFSMPHFGMFPKIFVYFF